MHHWTVVAAVALTCAGAAAQEQFAPVPPDASIKEIATLSAHVTPSPRQLRWQEVDLSAFVHFGMNTFTDREWGEGTEDPALFNPSDFDATQWVEACKSAGIGTLILTAKHHDGFCLWPSAYTSHSVKSSPWRGGQGDVVREVADACREGGIRLGIYLSPWDRHEPSYGDSPVYNEYFRNQLRELLTQYGPVAEVWFDGACGEGPNGKRQEYDFPSYYKIIRELQPDAVISVCGPDVRWCGNEAGVSRKTEWSVVPVSGSPETGISCDAQAADLGGRSKLAGATLLAWYPSQVNTSIRPGWFYHASEDNRVKPLSHLLDVYDGAVGGNSQFLLNIPPDPRGRFHENDVARLRELGEAIRATYGSDLAAGAVASASASAEGHAASGAVDSDPATYWTVPEGRTTGSIELDLGGPRTFDRLVLEEAIAEGQRVEMFAVDTGDANGQWNEVSSGTTIGHRRIVRLPLLTADRLRIRILSARDCPTLSRIGLFRAPTLVGPPEITRDRKGFVRIQAHEGLTVQYSVEAPGFPSEARTYAEPFELPDGGVVTATAVLPAQSDTPLMAGGSLTTVAEFALAKTGWTIVSVDSEENPERAACAIDGDPSTYWHTGWRAGEPAPPHRLVFDMGEERDLGGFTYLPRQDGQVNGTVAHYQLLTSLDGATWGDPVAQGEFGNIANNPVEQRVRFAQPVRARYVQFVALDEINGRPWASAAEIGLLPAPAAQ